MPEPVYLAEVPTPWGNLMLADREGRLALCDWTSSAHFPAHLRSLGPSLSHGSTPLLQSAAAQLREYLAGERTAFSLPLAEAPIPFTAKVREALLAIPYGATVTYKELARRVGLPGGVRAVARGVALNPLSIIVPCHRVIGSDGSLTGYAGGLAAKSALLALERR